MTDYSWAGSDPIAEDGTEWEAEPILTKDVTENEAPEFGSCSTWSIPQNTIGLPIQLLQRRKTRYKSLISIIALGGATSIIFNSQLAQLQGTNPQGATFIAAANGVVEWESQQPLYVTAVGGGPATITVVTQSYAQR